MGGFSGSVGILIAARASMGIGGESVAGLGLLVTSVTYAFAYAATIFSLTLAYFVLPPALITVTVMWWATREV